MKKFQKAKTRKHGVKHFVVVVLVYLLVGISLNYALRVSANLDNSKVQSATEVVVAIINVPITTITAATNMFSSGKCEFDEHWLVVCYGGWLSERNMARGGAFATGNTVNVYRIFTDSSSESSIKLDRPGLLHEWGHSRQWAAFGPTFLPYYILNWAVTNTTRSKVCWNIFEWDAGFEIAGYRCSQLGVQIE